MKHSQFVSFSQIGIAAAVMTSSDDHGSMLNIVNGLAVPRMITQERVDQLKTLKLYHDDVFIVTPGASGTTWMQQIVRLIRGKGEQDSQILSDAVPWVEASSGVAFGCAETDGYATNVILEDMPRPRAFKTHFNFRMNSLPVGCPTRLLANTSTLFETEKMQWCPCTAS